MSHNTYNGLSSNISAPPTTVAIVSSTLATPIVITSATHNLSTGDSVIINGHLVNTAANGVWPAVVVLSSTTFSLTGSVGIGVGVATGTVQNLNLGTTDMVTDGNDPLAAEWTTPDACALDRTAFLWKKMCTDLKILKGGVMTLLSGAVATIAGQFTFEGSVSEPARLIYGANSRLNIPVTRLSDANHTVNASTDGPVIILAKPTAVRTITIEQAADTVKVNGDTLEFWMPIPPTADPSLANYVIKREGSANNIAVLWGKYFPTAGALDAYPGFCRVHLEGGVWRLSGGAGVNFDTDA